MLIIYFSYYAFFICIHCVSFLKFHDVVSVGSAIYWHYCVMILIKSKTPTKLCNPWLLCLIIYRLLMILISSLVANSSLSSHKFTYNFIWRLLYFSFYSMFSSLYSWILFFVIHIYHFIISNVFHHAVIDMIMISISFIIHSLIISMFSSFILFISIFSSFTLLIFIIHSYDLHVIWLFS